MGGKLTFPGGGWYHATKYAIEPMIEKAINAARPKARYRVTPSAHFLMTQRAITPDRVGDTFMASQFLKHGAKSFVTEYVRSSVLGRYICALHADRQTNGRWP